MHQLHLLTHVVQVLDGYPLIANLVGRVGALPNISNWMKTRPENREEQSGYKIYFRNAFQILADQD